MAKKNRPSSTLTAQEKARQMREAQKKSDQRTRNIIIAVVSVLVIAIIVAMILVIVNRPAAKDTAEGLPQQYAAGEPITVSAQGVGGLDPEVGDLYLYFDYTCAGCVNLDAAVGPFLTDAAQAGEFNFMLQPVITAGGPYNVAATAGAIVVAAEEPELFLEFHEALINYYAGLLTTQDSSAVADNETALGTVKAIAAQVGVSDQVIEEFDLSSAQKYLTESTNAWVARDVKGRESTASPELVFDNTKLQVSGSNGQELFESIQSGIAALGG